jgi:hypothetical protein
MFYSNKSWLNTFNKKETSDAKLYLEMLYHSAISFSLVDISPRTKKELAFFSLVLLLSSMFNAIIYGTFGVLWEKAGAKS